MKWIKPSDIPEPQRSAFSCTAEFDLAYDVWAAIQNAGYNFLHGDRGSTQDYMASMVQFAFHETQNIALNRAPVDWNWSLAGVKAAAKCFEYLSQIPVALGDPNTVSVMDAWVSGKGALYGGHDPIPVAVPAGGSSNTGPSAAPGSPIFGSGKS